MFFNALSCYRIDENAFTIDALRAALAARPCPPIGGLDWKVEGFVAPYQESGLVFPGNDMIGGHECVLIALRREEKVLPAGVIRDAVDAKVQEIERTEMRKVGRKEKLALKEQITDDLLPRAFSRASRLAAIVDRKSGWLLINTATASRAEGLVSAVREALPPFPALLPRTVVSPVSAMTEWVASGAAPEGFELGDSCVLAEPKESGARARLQRVDLTQDLAREMVASGYQVRELGLVWREQVAFSLTDALRLRRLQFLDLLQEEASQAEDVESLHMATLTIAAGAMRQLLDSLVWCLGGVNGASDMLLDDAMRVVRAVGGRVDETLLQRHLDIGYNRAGRLLEELGRIGVLEKQAQGWAVA